MLSHTKLIKVTILLLAILVSFQITKADSLKVLYLGNSHTFWHELPQMTAFLALSNGDTIIFDANTPGGCTLGHPQNGHLFNNVSLTLIDSLNWDYVILQEHSLFAVIDYYGNTYMYPGAMALDSLIKTNYPCTKTIMQLIWGKKFGGQYCINSHCSIDFDDFAHMQNSLTTKYLGLTNTISGIVAPTGEAWRQSITNGDPVELFDSDESHPSAAGTYLSACVYYSTLFQKSSVGSSYYAELSATDALYLQQIADQVVFYEPSIWDFTKDVTVAGFEIEQNQHIIYCTDTSLWAESYYWDFGDGTTDTVQNPVHMYTSSGTYVITQQVSSDCNSDVAYDTVDIVITGIPNTPRKIGITFIYELNADNVQIISANNNINEIKVYGINGLVYRTIKLIDRNKYLLDISSLPKGMYLISVQNNNEIITRKILK